MKQYWIVSIVIVSSLITKFSRDSLGWDGFLVGLLPSMAFSFGLCLLWVEYFKDRSKSHLFGFPVYIGAVIYEVSQIWQAGTFSYGDLVALTAGYGLAVLVTLFSARKARL